jgi:ribosome assembly protein YihI (activator of Der GTPase)
VIFVSLLDLQCLFVVHCTYLGNHRQVTREEAEAEAQKRRRRRRRKKCKSGNLDVSIANKSIPAAAAATFQIF